MQPPVAEVHRRRGPGAHAERDQSPAGEPAERRPPLERLAALGDPQRLEQETGDPEEEERADEHPVANPVAPPCVAAHDAIDSAVVEPRRLAAALRSHDQQADDQGGAEHVEEERVAQVERSPPEVPAEDGPREVVLESKDRRPNEEDDEAVEDHRVCEAGDAVAALDPGVRQHDPCGIGDALYRPIRREAPATAPVLENKPDDAPREDRRRDDDQRVPEPDLPVGQTGERLARLHQLVRPQPRTTSFASNVVGARTRRASRALPRYRTSRLSHRSGRR